MKFGRPLASDHRPKSIFAAHDFNLSQLNKSDKDGVRILRLGEQGLGLANGSFRMMLDKSGGKNPSIERVFLGGGKVDPCE